MKLDSVEKPFRKKETIFLVNSGKIVSSMLKKVKQSYTESDKILDVQVEKLVIALKGNNSSDSDSEKKLECRRIR